MAHLKLNLDVDGEKEGKTLVFIAVHKVSSGKGGGGGWGGGRQTDSTASSSGQAGNAQHVLLGDRGGDQAAQSDHVSGFF